jgi:hypothetical protein
MYLESLVYSSKKQSLMIEELNRFNFTPLIGEKSRVIAETQFDHISRELEKHNLKADYMDLMIKKGEIYKEHIG